MFALLKKIPNDRKGTAARKNDSWKVQKSTSSLANLNISKTYCVQRIEIHKYSKSNRS